MTTLYPKSGLLICRANSVHQFYFSLFTTYNTNKFLRRVGNTSHKLHINGINLHLTLKFLSSRTPKKIIFPNDSYKTETTGIIRNLFIYSFIRNISNFGYGDEIPTRNNEVSIIPIIKKNGFIIFVNHKTKFTICRINKYSLQNKNKNLIYDWKEIQRLENFLEPMDLSIKKILLNLYSVNRSYLSNFILQLNNKSNLVTTDMMSPRQSVLQQFIVKRRAFIANQKNRYFLFSPRSNVFFTRNPIRKVIARNKNLF